ncbi:MAG: hypothetical protein V9F04_05455 [Dermatophilaceae bacterium]
MPEDEVLRDPEPWPAGATSRAPARMEIQIAAEEVQEDADAEEDAEDEQVGAFMHELFQVEALLHFEPDTTPRRCR